MSETGFRIDGLLYEVPTLDSFTMGEAKLLYKCSGLTLEDFAYDTDDPDQVKGFQKNIRNPGFLETLMIVAFLRGNPDTAETKAIALIEQSNLVEALEAFVASAGGDADPPEQKPSETSNGDFAASSATQSVPSGDDSMSGSERPAEIRVLTGTSGLGTSQDLPPAA